MNEIQLPYMSAVATSHASHDTVPGSGGVIKRLRVTFINGWGISIIQGPNDASGVYGSAENGTYEAVVLDPDGNLNYDLTDGDVLGWETPDAIYALADKIAQRPGKTAAQTARAEMLTELQGK